MKWKLLVLAIATLVLAVSVDAQHNSQSAQSSISASNPSGSDRDSSDSSDSDSSDSDSSDSDNSDSDSKNAQGCGKTMVCNVCSGTYEECLKSMTRQRCNPNKEVCMAQYEFRGGKQKLKMKCVPKRRCNRQRRKNCSHCKHFGPDMNAKCTYCCRGRKCKTHRPTPCFLRPCQNGGKCKKLAKGEFQCDCAEGYEGELCENEIPPVTEAPSDPTTEVNPEATTEAALEVTTETAPEVTTEAAPEATTQVPPRDTTDFPGLIVEFKTVNGSAGASVTTQIRLNQTWSDALNDTNSTEYKALLDTMNARLTAAFSGNPSVAGFKITGFSPGSVLVQLVVDVFETAAGTLFGLLGQLNQLFTSTQWDLDPLQCAFEAVAFGLQEVLESVGNGGLWSAVPAFSGLTQQAAATMACNLLDVGNLQELADLLQVDFTLAETIYATLRELHIDEAFKTVNETATDLLPTLESWGFPDFPLVASHAELKSAFETWINKFGPDFLFKLDPLRMGTTVNTLTATEWADMFSAANDVDFGSRVLFSGLNVVDTLFNIEGIRRLIDIGAEKSLDIIGRFVEVLTELKSNGYHDFTYNPAHAMVVPPAFYLI